MLKKIANIFYDIRKGEWASAFLMFLLHLFLMVALYLLKPARDSLFLVEIGPKQLPLVYILLALVAIPVTQLLSNMTQKYDVKKVLHWSLLILILNLLILRWLLWLRDPWIYMVFYIWVGIFGLLVISQFWLYANGLYDAAQSKRLFSFLNLGAIIGAIAGSGASSLLVSNLGLDTRNLLYACIGILLVCVLIFRYLKQMQPAEEPGTLPEEERRTSAPEIIKTVFKSRYQLILAGIIGMTMLATTLVDYQFKSIAYDAYPVTAELTSFMGKFYGGLSFASFLIQILLSASIIRRLGLGGAVLSRPVGLTIGSILLMIEPVLATAIFIRGYDDATRYSIDKTGRELLYLPLSQRVKKKTKVFLDIFVDRFFRGIAGVFLLIFIFVIDLSVQQISFFVLIVTGCWITLGVMARREYVHKFRDSLSRRYVDPDNIALDLDESSLYESVRQALQSDNSSQILYVLNLVRGSDVDKLAGELSDLLHHQSSEIRHRALELLGSIQDQHYVDDVKKLLQDEDPDVRLEAIYYLCQHSEEDPSRVIQSYLDHSNEKLRSAALGCVSKHSTDGEGDQAIDESLIEELLNDKSRESVVISAQVAQALGYLSEGEKPRKYLPRLLNAKARPVAKAAIESVQRLKDDYFISDLLDKLDEPDLNLEVRNALASFGEDYLPLYKQKFMDESVELSKRRRIPGIFRQLPVQKSVDHLMEMLEQSNPELRYHVIKSLNKLRKNREDLSFENKTVREYLVDEAREYYELLSIKLVQRDNLPNDILIRSLKDKMNQSLERIFRLLGLIYNPMDMYGAYLGLQSGRNQNRAASIEFLDNILEYEDKQYFFPIVDAMDEKSRLEAGRELFELEVDTYEKGVLRLLESEDTWLKTCAIFSVSTACPEILQKKVYEALDDDHPLVRETAELVTKRLEGKKSADGYHH